jgi:hypothetical protein
VKRFADEGERFLVKWVVVVEAIKDGENDFFREKIKTVELQFLA